MNKFSIYFYLLYLVSTFSLILTFQNCSDVQFTKTGKDGDNIVDENGIRDFNKDQKFAIVFEDVAQGDFDYNDLVVKFSVREFYDSLLNLKKIEMLFYPRPFEAGFTNGLRFVADGIVNDLGSGPESNLLTRQTKSLFSGPGNIVVETVQGTSHCYSAGIFDKSDDVVIFASQQDSSYTIASNISEDRCVYKMTVNIHDPSLNPLSERKGFDITQYRFIMHITNNNRMVELADVNDGFIANHRPMAFFVPTDFAYPRGGAQIFPYYPYFDSYAQLMADGKKGTVDDNIIHWYNYPDASRLNELVDLL